MNPVEENEVVKMACEAVSALSKELSELRKAVERINKNIEEGKKQDYRYQLEQNVYSNGKKITYIGSCKGNSIETITEDLHKLSEVCKKKTEEDNANSENANS